MAIFRLVFKQMECTIDNVFNLRDLVLQELLKIIVVCYIKDLTTSQEIHVITPTQIRSETVH